MIACRTEIYDPLCSDLRQVTPVTAPNRSSVADTSAKAVLECDTVTADLSDVTVAYSSVAGGGTVAYSAYCNTGDTIEITDIGDGAIEAQITHEPTGLHAFVSQIDGVYRSLCTAGGKYIILARNTLPFKTEVAVARLGSCSGPEL